MQRYVDGFVLPIPADRLPEYPAIAGEACRIWKEQGALDYCECVADDLTTECSLSFTEMTRATGDETIIFAWAVFPSREARDAANEKINADPRVAELITRLTNAENPIIDFARMAHGGFREITGD